MNTVSTPPLDDTAIPLVTVLTSPWGGDAVGYTLGGFHPGPNVLVAGHSPIADLIYDRLLQLPTLGWMRGRLHLMCLDAMASEGLEAHITALIDPKPDELVFLPYQLDKQHHAEAANQGYWTVLRACTSLGMIKGRGVKSSSFEMDAQ